MERDMGSPSLNERGSCQPLFPELRQVGYRSQQLCASVPCSR
jgi:hypothetical protein